MKRRRHRPGVRLLPRLGRLPRATPNPRTARRRLSRRRDPDLPVSGSGDLVTGAAGPGPAGVRHAAGRSTDHAERRRRVERLRRPAAHDGDRGPRHFRRVEHARAVRTGRRRGGRPRSGSGQRAAAALAQGLGPAGQLVLFVKVADVAPDGTARLINALEAPVRIPDVTQAVHRHPPGIRPPLRTGHRIRLIVSGGSLNYRGGITPVPVTIPPATRRRSGCRSSTDRGSGDRDRRDRTASRSVIRSETPGSSTV